MKISELLELTQSKKLADIAKESLDIGEKRTVEALKKAGCYSISGKRGWHFDGKSSVLEQSIYEYSTPSKRGVDSAQKEVSATLEKATVVTNPSSQLSNEPENKQDVNPINKQISNPTNKQINKQVGKPTIQLTKNKTSKPAMKKVTYEIEEQLHDELKIKSIREKRTVSEIVNEIIKRGLQ
ncbi:hypothetical protein JFV29_13125 [Peribacillus sp. TH16]|uniref:hypothetical protein n=1 Tax=Peribacillus sp. TH16 TaxID=2798482 RepID=UPI001911EC82|nr:hypothetical protein [Peribacillus sp. TH16]MBK5482820.1 hypothetical protein [Peribacillus sp. TH16]